MYDTMRSSTEKIDFHVHCVPPSYREYCLKNEYAGEGHPDGMPAIPAWDVNSHISMMKSLNIKKSVLSMSSPGTHLTPGNDQDARALTRQVNEDMSKICKDHSEHFLFFASLPLPDVEGSLAEIDYALDHLGAVGFQILTNSHGIYPGDPRFNLVFDKLSERGAIVFFHPTSCHLRSEDGSVTRVTPNPGVASPVLEFMFDTTRSLTSIIASGTIDRCPGITFIITHCGGTFPPVLSRIARFSPFVFLNEDRVSNEEIKRMLETRFYFDLAGFPFPDQIHGLLRVVHSSRLLYGSDYPYTPFPLVKSLSEELEYGLRQCFGSASTEVFLKNGERLLSNSKGGGGRV
ncbi:hypothetical protein N7478_004214 [Penicillium angulare]|uniref:uncharacterized protein n=1 Tax=Penicillium angulare TaxID=116970 RepID=UPI00253FA621|nr:uncharacterized protein N7478_004214 [Penicillium angulare]KAJ5278842.1 hypothetical protein N7478_004214 [Penicillium angulare]